MDDLHLKKLIASMRDEVNNIDNNMDRSGSVKEAYYYKGMREGIVFCMMLLDITAANLPSKKEIKE